jgi:23S rRNA (guanosine2251-2'-O)-methyltransferase
MKPSIDEAWIWGRHAVQSALEGGRPIHKLYCLAGREADPAIGRLRARAREQGLVVQEVARPRLDQMVGGEAHQGVVALIAARSYAGFDAILQACRERPDPLVIILDGIEDPHNLGAIVRTACCAGAVGVVIPERRAAGLSGVVEKAAAGALEHVPVARVTNLVRAIEELKEAGVWIVGAEADGPQLPYAVDLKGAIGLVIGSEGQGMHRLVREHCDFVVRLPLAGPVNSLNASVAAGVLMFEAVRQRQASTP